jgi:prevent-host-death family protein
MLSEARRELGKLIEQAWQGQDVVIIKDSRPVAALRPIDDTDLDLAPELTDAQVTEPLGMVPGAAFNDVQFA